jgi:hypothetical protein
MRKIKTLLNKSLATIALLATTFGGAGLSLGNIAQAAVGPNWNLGGTYVISMNYNGSAYAHDMVLSQDSSGNITGTGGSPAGSNTYTWTVNSGTSTNTGNTFSFDANYTATPDAVTPQTVLKIMGTVASDGTLSGTWSDNYQGGTRSGTWTSTSGHAVALNTGGNGNGMVKVTILKYINGGLATATSGNNKDFTMNATWNAANIGSGSGQFTLSPNGFGGSTVPYQAVTTNMSSGASYSVNEVMNSNTATSCTTNGAPYAQAGYSYGDTQAAAQAATQTMTAPSLTNITSDKYIIVWNTDCSNNGQIGGTVTGGASSILKVNSVDVVKGTATADGTFANGWKYVFHITAPTNETKVSLKFGDWTQTGGSGTIAVANNVRISSAQANNNGATILTTAANTYPSTSLNLTTDLDPTTPGIQADITVEAAIPSSALNGSYTTSYGLQSLP